MFTNFQRALLSVLFLALVSLSLQGIPSVRCGSSNVLEEIEIGQTITEEDCDHKTVCELNCQDFIPSCKHKTFLDLDKLLKKDKNYQIAYQSSCQGGFIKENYLTDKLSKYYRHMIEIMSKVTQEMFFKEYVKSRWPLAMQNKYKNLWKDSSIPVIRKLPEFKKEIKFVFDMIMFEYSYTETMAYHLGGPGASTIWALYYYYTSLTGLKKLCKKKYVNMKDKSMNSVFNMIESEVEKQVNEAIPINGKCQGFCWYKKNLNDIGNNVEWKKYAIRMIGYLRQFYSKHLTKSLISGKKNLDRNYCSCRAIANLNDFLQDKRKSFDHIREKFPKGYSLAPFENYVKNFCKSQCEKVKISKAPRGDDDEDEEGDE
jgi:hypothetical protein